MLSAAATRHLSACLEAANHAYRCPTGPAEALPRPSLGAVQRVRRWAAACAPHPGGHHPWRGHAGGRRRGGAAAQPACSHGRRKGAWVGDRRRQQQRCAATAATTSAAAGGGFNGIDAADRGSAVGSSRPQEVREGSWRARHVAAASALRPGMLPPGHAPHHGRPAPVHPPWLTPAGLF